MYPTLTLEQVQCNAIFGSCNIIAPNMKNSILILFLHANILLCILSSILKHPSSSHHSLLEILGRLLHCTLPNTKNILNYISIFDANMTFFIYIEELYETLWFAIVQDTKSITRKQKSICT